MCRRSLISLLALLLVSSSLWAFPGRVISLPETKPIATSAPAVPAEEPKTDSGSQEPAISTEPSPSSTATAIAKAEEGRRLTNDEVLAIRDELNAAKADYAALQAVASEKDKVINSLARDNASLKDETGTKAYLMLDGIIGFSDGFPSYGIGLTLGTRIGNSLMLELGADYMLGANLEEVMKYSLDNWSFRAGIGWMF